MKKYSINITQLIEYIYIQLYTSIHKLIYNENRFSDIIFRAKYRYKCWNRSEKFLKYHKTNQKFVKICEKSMKVYEKS